MAAVLVAGTAAAQPYGRSFARNQVWASMGAALPGHDLGNVYQLAPAWGFGYGFRPLRYLQLDAGLDMAYNSAEVDYYYYNPAWGPLRVRDFQYFVPLGGRVIAPLAHGRFEIYGGGGAAYMRYAELLSQPNNYVNLGCPTCQARDGWGYYATAGFDVALDRGQHFRLGAASKVYRATTQGAPVGATPPWSTRDQWINTYLTFAFAF